MCVCSRRVCQAPARLGGRTDTERDLLLRRQWARRRGRRWGWGWGADVCGSAKGAAAWAGYSTNSATGGGARGPDDAKGTVCAGKLGLLPPDPGCWVMKPGQFGVVQAGKATTWNAGCPGGTP